MIKTLLCNANKHKLGNRTKPGWKFLLYSASPSCSSPLDPPTRMSAWRGVLSTDSTPEHQVIFRSKFSTKYLIPGTSLLVELATTRPIPLTTVSVERYVSQVDVWWTACKERWDRHGVVWIEYHRDYKAWINLDRDTNLLFRMRIHRTGIFRPRPRGLRMKKWEQMVAVAVKASGQTTSLYLCQIAVCSRLQKLAIWKNSLPTWSPTSK